MDIFDVALDMMLALFDSGYRKIGIALFGKKFVDPRGTNSIFKRVLASFLTFVFASSVTFAAWYGLAIALRFF